MRHKTTFTCIGAFVALLGTANASWAGHGRPGSLLLFPEYDTVPGRVTVLTVTNSSLDDPINAQFQYIGRGVGGGPCFEFNRIEFLTPGDTFTTLAQFHNPTQERGFVYVEAEDPNSFGVSIAFNHLIGASTLIDGVAMHQYSLEPYSFLGISGGEGAPTDINGNGRADLDGNEYEPAADTILVPRFLASGRQFQSDLILLNLTFTTQGMASVDSLVWNDNEEVFSTEYTFNCWDRVPLTAISGLFMNEFLRNFTNNDPAEVIGLPGQESGWFNLSGSEVATSLVTVADPTILAVLVETSPKGGASATLPFETGVRDTGSLIQFNAIE